MSNETSTTQAEPVKPAEPSMAEYAAIREAEMRGEKPEVKAVTTETTEEAAATEATAAAAEEEVVESETPSEAATEEPAESKAEVKKESGINKRFSELTAQKKEAQALAEKHAAEAEQAKKEAAEAKAEAERLRAEAEKAQAAIPKVVEEKDDPAPKKADFDDPDEYTAEVSRHAARQALREASIEARKSAEARAEEARKNATEAQQKQVQKAIAELHADFQKRVAEAKDRYPDYDEKVTNNDKISLRNDVFFAIEKAQDSPDILYFLADNPAEAEALNKLDQASAMLRIGELQAELRIARKPKPSKAATPHKPIGNRASPQPKSLDEMSMPEYAEMRERELAANAGKRRSRLI